MKTIGAAWKSKTKDGQPYLNGSIEIIAGMKQKVMIFQNTKKVKETDPDYNIVLSDPKPAQPAQTPQAPPIQPPAQGVHPAKAYTQYSQNQDNSPAF